MPLCSASSDRSVIPGTARTRKSSGDLLKGHVLPSSPRARVPRPTCQNACAFTARKSYLKHTHPKKQSLL